MCALRLRLQVPSQSCDTDDAPDLWHALSMPSIRLDAFFHSIQGILCFSRKFSFYEEI